MITITTTGSFRNTEAFLQRMKSGNWMSGVMNRYGKLGVERLAAATPVDSGLTASSWSYTVVNTARDEWYLTFHNTNIVNHVSIAIILQYGHGTKNGGWVEGRDYINPAIQPIFDQVLEDVWKEVTR